MSERPTLLPTGASALERAVDRAAPQWDQLAATLRAAGAQHPDQFLPWLAAEWGLADLARHFPSTQALIDAALPWLFERGTPAAVLRALGWIGFPLARIDADGPWLHIDLGRTASTEEIARIAHVVRASIPAHVNFYRVYFAWDLRAITLDAAPALDNGVLDNESGAWVDIDGDAPLKVSFGRRRAGLLQRIASGRVRVRISSTGRESLRRTGRGALDEQRLDQPVLPAVIGGATTWRPRLAPAAPAPGAPLGRRVPTVLGLCPRALPAATAARTHTHAAIAPRPQPLARGWQGTWDATTWAASPILSRITTETA